jgi:hypothetical protein
MIRFLASSLVLLVLVAAPAAAQQADTSAAPAATPMQGQGKGVATLTDWPASLPQLLREMGRKAPYLLPRIDSLALEYRYAATDSTSQWSFVLGWAPDHRVLYNGDVLPYENGPSDVRMVNVELRADVRVDGESVGEMIVAVDSMALRSLPSIYSFEVTVGHDRVFLDASADEARRALAEGVTLDSLVVERMGFASSEASTFGQRRPDTRERRPNPRPYPNVYEPRTHIHVGWRIGPRPYYVTKKDGRRAVQPRRDDLGRSTADADDVQTRTAQREESGEDEVEERGSRSRADDEDDEDEDDTSLRAPALGAVAAIGLVAYAGGTVGLYGRGDTPLGLAAGYTRPGGGVQLHAAVNGAVIGGESGQKLTLKALGFYDVFSSRLQPAVGLGVQIDPQREGNVVPAVSLGVAGNFGSVVLFGGVDVVEGSPEVGLTYNFRHSRRAETEDRAK